MANRETRNEPADFETALEESGFGCFNILLTIPCFLCVMAPVFDVSSVSIILQLTTCDLSLTLSEKGVLNSMCYAGMMVGALPWGYIADTMGRRKVLIYGLFSNGIFVLLSSLSQNKEMLMACKFFGGLTVCGPSVVIFTYISECHSIRYRARIIMLTGLMLTLSVMLVPAIAYFLLPHHWSAHFGGLHFHNWHFFLAALSIPSLMGGIMFIFVPESPRYLMFKGHNDQALHAFQTIYALNNMKSKDTYPIKELIDETPEKTAQAKAAAAAAAAATLSTNPPRRLSFSERRRSAIVTFREGLTQLKPMFSQPYLGLALLVNMLSMFIFFGYNSIRLWLPQMFSILAELALKGYADITICNVFDMNRKHDEMVALPKEKCDVHSSGDAYLNMVIVTSFSIIGFIVVNLFVNIIDNKDILTICLVVSAVVSPVFYYTTSSSFLMVTAAIFIAFTGICSTLVLQIAITLFPTAMRSMVVAVAMTFGRLGSVLAGTMFPVLVSLHCIAPFILICIGYVACFIMSIFIPKINRVSL